MESRPLPPARRAPGTERAAGRPGDPRPIVVLDPGHGGIDHGASAAGNGVTEKQIVLEFALILRDLLEQHRPLPRRDDAHATTPSSRSASGCRSPASARRRLFISIHADALRKGEGDAQGATVYTLVGYGHRLPRRRGSLRPRTAPT